MTMEMKITKRTCLSAGEPLWNVLEEGLGEKVTTVSPVRVPMDVRMPYVLYGVSGATGRDDKQRTPMDTCLVTLDIFGESYGDCVDISEKARELLCGMRITHTFQDGGTLVVDCSRMTDFEDGMTSDGYYHRSVSFRVKSV